MFSYQPTKIYHKCTWTCNGDIVCNYVENKSTKNNSYASLDIHNDINLKMANHQIFKDIDTLELINENSELLSYSDSVKPRKDKLPMINKN
jgi:hypothetical protein